MKKIVHIILGMILGMGTVFLSFYLFALLAADLIEDSVYNYGFKHGRADGILEVLTQWDPYLEVMGENDIPILSIHLKDDRISVVKENDKYVIKKSWQRR